MAPGETLTDLLLRYEQLIRQGQTPTAEEMCSAHPELVQEFRRRVSALGKINQMVADDDPYRTTSHDQYRTSDPSKQGTPETRPPGDTDAKNPGSSRYVGTENFSLPGYEILHEIDRGGMGVVYKARQKGLGRLVAIKMILAGGHAGPSELARFRIEAEAVARLQHPNIIQIHEIGEHDGLPFFSMEFCGGGSLAKKLNHTPLPPLEAAQLVETLALAMHAAHEKNIIHRDLKPQNVLLAEDGTPKITDFGLAKKLDEAAQTTTGTVMGTPSYMAPEQAGGKSELIGPLADVYALGAILYECLTGRPPFKAATAIDTIRQVLDDEPVSVRQLQTHVPRDLETICMKCLAKSPAQRYATAADLAADLKRYFAGEPILARPVGSVERFWRWCKRKPGLAIAGTVAVFGVLLALTTLAIAFSMVRSSLEQETKARQNADDRRERAEEFALRIRFDQLFSRATDDPVLILASGAQLLPEAARLKNQSLLESMRLHLGSSVPKVRLRSIIVESNDAPKVAISANGKVALSFDDKTARLWETSTLKPLAVPLRHDGSIGAAALSADGTIALTLGNDKTSRMWDTSTGKPLRPPLQYEGDVHRLALSADGKIALTVRNIDFARVWDTATGKPLGPSFEHQRGIIAVALSADGKIAITGGDDNRARLWDTTTGEPIGLPFNHPDTVQYVALSSDGKIALTLDRSGSARLWGATTGKPLRAALQQQDRIIAGALSDNGKIAITASSDTTARLWDTQTGEQLGSPLRHGAVEVSGVALSADGKIALTSSGWTRRIWETTAGTPPGLPLLDQNGFWRVALSANGKMALTSSEKKATLWDTTTGKPRQLLPHHQGEIHSIALSADGKIALTASDDTARLWDTGTGKPFGKPLQPEFWVGAVALSADGTTALTAGRELALWETATGMQFRATVKESGHFLALSADGKIALGGTGPRGNRVKLLWTATGNSFAPPLEHNQLTAVAISADGKTALTGSRDKTARLWDTSTGNPLGVLHHQGIVRAVALSRDAKIALTGSDDKTARFWDTATGKQIGPTITHPSGVRDVALSVDGKIALTASLKMALLSNAPQSLAGDPERIRLWAQVITGLEVDDHGTAHVLDAATWQERRQQLEKLGGPPEGQ